MISVKSIAFQTVFALAAESNSRLRWRPCCSYLLGFPKASTTIIFSFLIPMDVLLTLVLVQKILCFVQLLHISLWTTRPHGRPYTQYCYACSIESKHFKSMQVYTLGNHFEMNNLGAPVPMCPKMEILWIIQSSWTQNCAFFLAS
jgi:hypothetical protein